MLYVFDVMVLDKDRTVGFLPQHNIFPVIKANGSAVHAARAMSCIKCKHIEHIRINFAFFKTC